MVLSLVVVPSIGEFSKIAFTSLYWMRVLLGCSSMVPVCLFTLISDKSRVEDELLEIPFIDQVLKVPSYSSAVHCEVASPFVEGTIVSRFRPFRVR